MNNYHMINTTHLLKVISAWVSITYIVCYFGVMIYPSVRGLFFQYALHVTVPIASDFFGIGNFISGLIIWNIVAIVNAWLFVILFNKIKQ